MYLMLIKAFNIGIQEVVENQWEVTLGGRNIATPKLGFVWVNMKVLSKESKVLCVKGTSITQSLLRVNQVVLQGVGCT